MLLLANTEVLQNLWLKTTSSMNSSGIALHASYLNFHDSQYTCLQKRDASLISAKSCHCICSVSQLFQHSVLQLQPHIQ